MKLYFQISLLMLLISSSLVRADLYECMGMWTNKPCEDGVVSRMVEEVPERLITNKKWRILERNGREFSKLMEGRYSLEFDGTAIVTDCKEATGAVEKCKDELLKSFSSFLQSNSDHIYKVQMREKQEMLIAQQQLSNALASAQLEVQTEQLREQQLAHLIQEQQLQNIESELRQLQVFWQ